ncbi:MAG: hypothetical protein ACPGPF_01720 [Pontibacterium sp.]
MSLLTKQQRKRFKIALAKRADNYQQNLKILITGFLLFVAGGIAVLVAEFLPGTSLAQEISAFIGLLFIGVGIIIATFGYICLSVLRLFRILMDD